MSLQYITADWIMNAKDGDQCSIIDPATNKSVDVVLGFSVWSEDDVYFNTLDSDIEGYWDSDKDDNRSYEDFIKHVRHAKYAIYPRKEWVDIISSEQYCIG